jgi:hypothetical protein
MNYNVRKEKKAVVFVIRHSDAVIVRAARGKNKKGIRVLLIELEFDDMNGEPKRFRDVFSDSEKDQRRLKLLCRAISVNPRKVSLDDLLARRVLLVQIRRQSEEGKRFVWGYFPAKKASAGKLHRFWLKNRLFERTYKR